MAFGVKVRNTLTGLNYNRCETLINKARSKQDGKPISKSLRVVVLADEPEPVYALRLYSTDVMTFYANGMVAVTLGGWATMTTLEVINSAAKHFHVCRKGTGSDWFISYNIPYQGGDPRSIRRVTHVARSADDTITLPINPHQGRAVVERRDYREARSYVSPQVVAAPPIRKIAKSRKMVHDPKVGDTFRFKGKEYILLESSNGLVAEPYHGDLADSRYRIVSPDDQALDLDFSNQTIRVMLPTLGIEQIERYTVAEQPWKK